MDQPDLVPIPLVESALLPSAIAGSCDLRTVVNLVFLNHLAFIVFLDAYGEPGTCEKCCHLVFTPIAVVDRHLYAVFWDLCL